MKWNLLPKFDLLEKMQTKEKIVLFLGIFTF